MRSQGRMAEPGCAGPKSKATRAEWALPGREERGARVCLIQRLKCVSDCCVRPGSRTTQPCTNQVLPLGSCAHCDAPGEKQPGLSTLACHSHGARPAQTPSAAPAIYRTEPTPFRPALHNMPHHYGLVAHSAPVCTQRPKAGAGSQAWGQPTETLRTTPGL